jgi:hypothetical protein
MAIETAVKIDVDVNGIQTVQQAATVYEDLGDAVAKTQREAEALALQFGINDKRTQDAIKVAGQYKQQLEQLDQAVDANRGNTQKLFGAIQGVAAGFEVAAGAMALFGGESKELDKVLVKVQGAMVFAQGLRDLKEFAPAIKAINSGFLNMIKTLKGVKLALAATGIGALVAVVGLFGEQIGQLFDSLKEKFKGFTDSIGLTNFAAEEAIKTQGELVDSLNRELAVMEARGDSESELFKKRLEIAKEEEKLANQKLAILKKGEEGYTEAEKAALDASNNILIIQANENARLKALNDEKLKNQQDFNQKMFDERLKEIEQEKKIRQDVKDLQEQYSLESKDLYKQDYLQKQKDMAEQFEKERELVTDAYFMGLLTEEEFTKLNEAQQEAHLQRRIGLDKAYLNAKLEQEQKLTEQGFSILTDLMDAFTSDQAKQSEGYFKTQKAFNIAKTLIDTYYAAQLAYNSQFLPIPDPSSIVRGAVAAGVAIASGLARVAAISRTKFSPNSAPSSVAPSSAIGSSAGISVPTTRLPQGQDILTQERRVFVLEGDITRTQRRAATNQNVSVLGG